MGALKYGILVGVTREHSISDSTGCRKDPTSDY
jgi:hypothetical protein